MFKARSSPLLRVPTLRSATFRVNRSSSGRMQVLLLAGVLGVGLGQPSRAQARSRRDSVARDSGTRPGQESQEVQENGKGRFKEGFFTGRFRRQGLFSSLTLGMSSCVDGKGKCGGSIAGITRETKPSVAFNKEIGYRIPWLLVGASYSLGFLKPAWTMAGSSERIYKRAYQHSLLAVLRPTVPFWRIDLGMNIAPGWSRQVFRTGTKQDRVFTQGFALGLGGVASVYLTREWIVGWRSDVILNFHNKACSVLGGNKDCLEIDGDSFDGFHTAIHGVYLSHRW